MRQFAGGSCIYNNELGKWVAKVYYTDGGREEMAFPTSKTGFDWIFEHGGNDERD